MEETQETQEETEPKKRRHKKNARLALETLCDRLESCINAPNQKPAKMIDALQKVADVRLRLLDYDTATASDAAIAENAALKTQRDADLAEITRLRNQKREIVTIQDEEAPKLRQQVAEQQKALESLQSFIKYLASEVKGDGDKPKMAITLILKFGRTAREYVTGLGIAFDSYFAWLNNPQAMAEVNLRASVDPPVDEHIHNFLNRPMVSVEFAIAALAVCYQIAIKAPVRKVNGVPRSYASLCPKNLFDDD